MVDRRKSTAIAAAASWNDFGAHENDIRVNDVILLAAVFGIAFLAGAAPAIGHNRNETYLHIDAFETRIAGTIEMRVVDAGVVFDLDADADGRVTRAEFEAQQATIFRTFRDRLAFAVGGRFPETSRDAHWFREMVAITAVAPDRA